MFLIAQKKGPDALNATQNPPSFLQGTFSKKIEKNLQNLPFFCRFGKKWVFL